VYANDAKKHANDSKNKRIRNAITNMLSFFSMQEILFDLNFELSIILVCKPV
jgi:hypothetical protein